MNSAKWTWFAIGYQCGFAYAVSLVFYQLGMLFSGNFNLPTMIGSLVAIGILAVGAYLVVRPAVSFDKKTDKK
jgi:ferrous iron transport protein B